MRSYQLLCSVSLAFALSLFGHPSVHADKKQDAAAIARKHNVRAAKLFNLGKFAEAAKAYEQAYQAKPVPAFLYNLGQCHKRMAALKDLKRARFYFESFINSAPKGTNVTPAKMEIDALDREIERLQRARPAEADADTDTKTATPAFVQPPVAEAQPQPEAQASSKQDPFYKRWWFWTIVGAAVVGATTVTVVALQPEDQPLVPGTLGSVSIPLR